MDQTLREMAEAKGIAVSANGARPTAPLHFTDYGNAQRFIAEANGDVLSNDVWKVWHVWDGTRFARDQARAVEKIAYRTTRRMYREAYELGAEDDRRKLAAWAIHSENRQRITAMLESSKAFVSVLPGDFDNDPWVLNLLNGTLELKTRALRPHSKSDRLSRRTEIKFDPKAECPFFLAFLQRIFDGDAELIAYVRRVFGYALTGVLAVHALFIFYGTGRNGKSTLLYVLRQLAGEYAVHVRADVFTDARSDPQGFSLVNLAGARIVTAVETGAGRRLDEGMVKAVTGGDPITAAPKYGREFSFYPVFKPFLATNHRPEIWGADDGIWSRPRLIPFNVRIPDEEQIPDDLMKAKLDAELPGILNWALDGLEEFDRIGLADPETVKAATSQYRQESDILGDWIEARCNVGPACRDETKALFDDYKAFAGEDALSKKRFGQALEERGYHAERTKTARLRVGIARRSVTHRDASPDTKVTHQSSFQESLTRAREEDFPEKPVTRVTRHPDVTAESSSELCQLDAGNGAAMPDETPDEGEVLPPGIAGVECPEHPFADVERASGGWRCTICGTQAVSGVLRR